MSISKTRDEFVDKFCEDFVCSVCLCIPFPSHAIEATCCGSFFCYPCLQGCREKKEICPNCNGEFQECPPRLVRDGNKFALKKLLGLFVYCDTKFLDEATPDGDGPPEAEDCSKCDWQGAWGDMTDHLKRCDYVNVSCLWNNCPKIVPRRAAEEHEKVCNFRTVFCEFCSSALPHNVLQKHHASDCVEYPIQCECTAPGIVRSTFVSHVTFDCPLALLSCKVVGCSEQVYRKDSIAHEASCVYRAVTCEFCAEILPFNLLTSHHTTECECVLVECPNSCGTESMQRKNLAAHDEICPTLPVVCMFEGCSTKVERRALVAHMQEGMAYHFQILYQQVSSLQRTVTTLTDTVSANQEEIEDLHKTIEQRDKTIADFTKKYQFSAVNSEATATRLTSVESKVKELRGLSVSRMVHGPFYLSMQYMGTVTFYAADVEWAVNLTKATKGPALFLAMKDAKNGAIGVKVSFTFTLFLDRGPVTTSTSKLEITKAQTSGIYIEAQLSHQASPYRTAISDFKVNEFMW